MVALSKNCSNPSSANSAPFYARVPKTPRENVAYRRATLEAARRDPDTARALYAICAQDCLFWLNTFGWIYEPRTPAVLPFITYECQDHAINTLLESLGTQDVGIEKSRDMGASWLVLAAFCWRWQFHPMQSFLLVSRTEDLVESGDDSDALFWKWDFLLRYQPPWLRPPVKATRMNRKNLRTGSVVNGCSTTGNVGRGGRRTGAFLDEFHSFFIDDGYRALASTQAMTNTRVFVSTPQGSSGAFYDVMHDPYLRIAKLRLHWSEHPLKRQGLYTTAHGRLQIIDTEYRFDRDYPFVLDGKLRSPWYDNECLRCPVPKIIAQELDIDYLGSNYLFFDREVIQRAVARDSRPPFLKGELNCDPETGTPERFTQTDGGRTELWMYLDAYTRPPAGNYVIGCDVATGTTSAQGKAASKSAAKVYNATTRELVASFVVSGMRPKEFAGRVVSLSRWLAGDREDAPFLIWEANGPGREFGDEVIRLGHRHIHYKQRNEGSVTPTDTEIPGWWSTKANKRALLAEYERCLATGEIVNRSERALLQMEQFVKLENGSVQHVASIGKGDPNQTGDDHGDEVIADALATFGCITLRKSADPDNPIAAPAPEGSLAWRRQQQPETTAPSYWADARRGRKVSHVA